MASSTIKLSDEKAPTVGTAALSNARTVLLDLSVLGGASVRSAGTGSIRPDGPP